MADQICELKTANKNSYTSGKRYSNQTGNATPIRRRAITVSNLDIDLMTVKL